MSLLQGVRVWLSASVPEDISSEDKDNILGFVKKFASDVFRNGGHIIHGSHPSITPTLLSEAEKYHSITNRSDCLILVVSRLWSKDQAAELQEQRKKCVVYETPEANKGDIRDESLKILRHWMGERADAFVAVGGKLWSHIPDYAGIPIEINEAVRRGLPCFLLGGLGGAVTDFINKHSHLMHALRNGLDDETNKCFVARKNIDELPGIICQQLGRLPVIRGRASDGASFRILALDGGGIKGVFTASVLATLEDALGESIASHFDLIAGTSTGGILAVGLGIGLSPQELLNFYCKHGSDIFPITEYHKSILRTIRHFFTTKYSNNILANLLQESYCTDGCDKTLGESLCRLVIPAYDATSGLCHIFRTPHNKLFVNSSHIRACEVATATASAPTYFSASNVKNMIADSAYLDGGVWANCPTLAGIVEAVCYLSVPLERIDVLSIGTTDEPFTVKRFTKAGIAKWNKTLIELFMNAQVNSSVTHSRELIGDARFIRINATTPNDCYKLDNPKGINELKTLGNKHASEPSLLAQIGSRFLNGIHALDWKQDIA